MPMEVSHIWLGHFPSEVEFERYFKEIDDDYEDDYDDMYRDEDDDEDETAADAELHEEEAGDGAEVYADDAGETPINKFAQEQEETFYDDDWVERSFNDAGDLRALIAGHSHSKNYIKNVMSLAASQELPAVNVFIMADREEFDSPRSVRGERHTLWYLGEFSTQK